MFGSIRSALRNIDARDWILVAGLLLIGAGLWPVQPAAALSVPGAVLVYVAIFGVKSDPN